MKLRYLIAGFVLATLVMLCPLTHAAGGPAPVPKATVTFTQGTRVQTLPAIAPTICGQIAGSVIRYKVGNCPINGSYVQFPANGGDVVPHWSAQDACPVKPLPLTQHADCPAGTKGSGWTQTADWASSPAPTCWVLGPYLPTVSPAGVCVPIVIPPTNGLPPGSTLHALWVGNSLTNTPPDFNDYSQGPLANRLAPMLAEMGITLTGKTDIQSGAEFEQHAQNAATMADIRDPQYDVVNYQGYYHCFTTPACFEAAVAALYNAGHGAGSWAMFEAMWTYVGDPGSPQNPAASLAVEGAANDLAGSNAVQVGRVWGLIQTTNPALFQKLHADSTHQSAAGEYLNCLIYTRFFSGRSVANISSISTTALSELTLIERTTLKNAVDSTVTLFYTGGSGGTGGGGGTNQAPVANWTSIANGLTVTFTDASHDPDGTITAHNWGFGDAVTSTQTNPVHTFAAAGTYEVGETVVDNGTPPLQAQKFQNVTVTAATPPTLQPPVNQTQLITFAKPARGVPLITQFGTTETRITDHAVDRPGSTCARNDYSRRQPFNADKSRIFVYECGGNWLSYRTNPIGFEKVLSGPLADAEIQWSPTDPDKLYYIDTNGGSRLYELTVSTNTHTTFYDFGAQVQALLGSLADRCWTKSEGSPSADNRRWGFMCQHYTQSTGNFDMKGFVVLDVIANQVLWSKVTTTAPDHVSMTPSGRYFVFSGDDAQGTQSVRVADGATCLLHHKSEHSDIGARSNGHDFYVSIDFQAGNGDVFWEDIDDCYSQPGPTRIATRNVVMHVYNNPWFGPHYSEHFSAKAVDFFTFAGYGYAPAPLLGYSITAGAWYGLGATMTTCGDYFCEIQAAISRDGKSLLFNDTFGPTANVDAYRLDLR